MTGRARWAAVVFDLDGTLVRAEHDYAEWKRELGLPRDLAVLEGIATLPPEAADRALRAIDAWEQAEADGAVALDGARALLDAWAAEGARLGIVTRNTRATALRALRAAGLSDRFAEDAVVGRDEAPPKPAPDGIRRLLVGWSIAPRDAAMVGDFRFDLVAARAAGVWAVGYDPAGTGVLDPWADEVVSHLGALAPAAPR